MTCNEKCMNTKWLVFDGSKDTDYYVLNVIDRDLNFE